MAQARERHRRLWQYLHSVYTNELNEDSLKYDEQPEYIIPPLFYHQKTLLAAAINLEKTKFTGLDCGTNKTLYTNFGVISDRVGSGKSLVALSLVKQPLPDEREIITIHRHNNLSMVHHRIPEPTKRRCKAALFIIPHSLMGQWEEYVTRDTKLNVIFCRKKKEVCDPTLFNFIDNVDAIFVSSTMWSSFETIQKPDLIHWSRIFIDEADTIQSSTHVQLSANFIWLITASFLNIAFPSGIYIELNSYFYPTPPEYSNLCTLLKETNGDGFRILGIYTNLQFVKKILGTTELSKNYDLEYWRLILRNSDEYVNNSFIMPSLHHHVYICKTTTNIRILESIIPNEVMAMLHAGDTKGALQVLGVTDETPTSIITSLSASLIKELEQQKRRLEFYKTVDYSSEIAKQKSLETQQEKITSLENRIDTIKKRMDELDTTNCPICYSDIETPTLTPCCKNLFCFICLCESIKRQTKTPICPLCRADINSINDLHVVNKSGNTIENNEIINEPKTKVEEFINFVEKNPKAKILLFSSYDASFFQLTSEMLHRNISYSTINGSTNRVSKIIGEFAEGNYRVLLLNSRHVGAGLNITCATDVFLFHKMSSEMEKQIIGRAYRMGRKEPLHVHHLLHQNETNRTAVTL
jgi:hypothetical protein